MSRSNHTITRRNFLKKTSTLAAFSIVPIHVLSGRGYAAPSETVNIANIGIAGMGRSDINAVNGKVNFVAMCDVDWNHAGQTFKDFPQTRVYKDYRKMLDEVDKDIDAVMVATPDHTHAVAGMAAITRNKHLYCQKPLAHSIYEVRQLMKAAKEHNVITQLGNQGHAASSMRNVKEWIADGAIGDVTEAHCFCNSNYSAIGSLGKIGETHDIPKTLSWNLWLGPAAKRNYHPMYLPGSWRYWNTFGTGVMGDWTCHVVDPIYWALDLKYPDRIHAEVTDYNPTIHGETFPPGSKVTYHFPAEGNRKELTLTWFDGVIAPPRPEELEQDRALPPIGGVIIGTQGKIMHGSHGADGARLIPESRMQDYKRPAQTLARIKGSHYDDWLAAIKESRPAGSDLPTYGGPLTEIALLGIIAIRHPGEELHYDAAAMRFTNNDSANKTIQPVFRTGWSL